MEDEVHGGHGELGDVHEEGVQDGDGLKKEDVGHHVHDDLNVELGEVHEGNGNPDEVHDDGLERVGEDHDEDDHDGQQDELGEGLVEDVGHEPDEVQGALQSDQDGDEKKLVEVHAAKDGVQAQGVAEDGCCERVYDAHDGH